MSHKFIVTIMLGMNRFSEKDTDHPFDMSCLDGFNTIWLPQISKIEKTHSTPIYEVAKTIDEFITDYNSDCLEMNKIIKEDFLFIIGRGTIGNDSEERIVEAFLEARRTHGRNAFHIVYSKSYGVVDTLRAFKIINDDEGGKVGADLMFCIDGYAPLASRISISKMYKNDNGENERMFNVPSNVKRAFAIVQRKDIIKGLFVGRPKSNNHWNFIVKQSDVNGKYYKNYSDGYERKLEISHFNMEEIVSTIPLIQYATRKYTVNELIKYYCLKYKEGKL